MELTKMQAILLSNLIDQLDESIVNEGNGKYRVAIDTVLGERDVTDLGQLRNKVAANISDCEW